MNFFSGRLILVLFLTAFLAGCNQNADKQEAASNSSGQSVPDDSDEQLARNAPPDDGDEGDGADDPANDAPPAGGGHGDGGEGGEPGGAPNTDRPPAAGGHGDGADGRTDRPPTDGEYDDGEDGDGRDGGFDRPPAGGGHGDGGEDGGERGTGRPRAAGGHGDGDDGDERGTGRTFAEDGDGEGGESYENGTDRLPGNEGPAGPPAEGGEGSPQQSQTPNIPEGSPEYAVYHFVLKLTRGDNGKPDYEALSEFISPDATGDLKELRSGKPSTKTEESFKRLLGRVKFYRPTVKRNNEGIVMLINDRNTVIRFRCRKKGDNFVIYHMITQRVPGGARGGRNRRNR